MPYTSMLMGHLHIVRWSTPLMTDVDRILNEVATAHRTAGLPLVGVSVVPPDAEPPRDDVRAAMVKNMDALLKCNEYVYFVMEGSGFRHSIMRSVLAGLLLVGGKRGKIGVERDIELAMQLACKRVNLPVATVFREARTRGVLSDADSPAITAY